MEVWIGKLAIAAFNCWFGGN